MKEIKIKKIETIVEYHLAYRVKRLNSTSIGYCGLACDNPPIVKSIPVTSVQGILQVF